MRDALAVIEAREIGEHEADRVAQTAIGFDARLDDLGTDAQVFGEIRARDPEAQDLRAVLLRDLLGRDDVAERFRHLAALLVEHEAVGQDRAIGRAAARAAGFQQRGLEPAAVLIGAFEIEIGAILLRPADHRSVSPRRRRGWSRSSNQTSRMSVTCS